MISEETVNAMKKARAESKRALKAISELLEHNFGYSFDRAYAAQQSLDWLIPMLNVEIDDYEMAKRREARNNE